LACPRGPRTNRFARLDEPAITITLDAFSHVMPGMQDAAAAKTDAGLRAAGGRTEHVGSGRALHDVVVHRDPAGV